MTAGAEILLSRDLIAFQLFDWLGVGHVDERPTLLAIIEAAQRLAVDKFLPHYRQSDIEEPRLDADGVHVLPAIHDALARFAELGLFGVSFSEELGGLGLPLSVALAMQGNFAAANIATAAYPMLSVANARLIATFGTPEQVECFARPQIAGRWFGTMCLSEPQAGSSLGDIRTRAVQEGEDVHGTRYRLIGNKMWISGGDHDASENIVHLVLAKIPQGDGTLPEGSKGISLFIVPKILPDGSRNDVAVAGLNHKLGYRGISNCLLNFGERQGAIGWRVGESGQGLQQMFMMMNEARIGVGMGAAALAYRGYRQSLRYAQERVQGRAIAATHGAAVPIFAHADVRHMLLRQKVYAEGALALCLYCANLLDQKGDGTADALLALLTPIAKSWPSEFGPIANDLAIQVHGGYGYTRDFNVEQLWRDNRLNPIHEGTNGIQAIDLLRRKLLLSNGQSFALLRGRIDATIARAQHQATLALFGSLLTDYWSRVEMILEGLKRRENVAALDDATMFLRGFGHGVVAWLWLDQTVTGASQPDGTLREGLAYGCRYFFESELPQAHAWLSIVAQHSDIVRAIPEEAFA